MKRLLLTTVSALALISARPGLAADFPTRMPVKAAPAPARVFSWTGCYLGGHAGWGWGRKTITDTAQGDLTALVGLPSVNFDTNGFLGGGQVGCDYQFAQNWVIGVEGSFSWADIHESAALPSTFPDTLTFQAKTDWMATATGRLGYTWDRWLVYAKGGVAWAHDKYNAVSATGYVGSWAASETRSGWTVGGGLEWAFADNWSAKLEYQYYDFGSRDVAFVGGAGAALLFLNPSIETVKQQIQTVTVGVNYRFSGLFH